MKPPIPPSLLIQPPSPCCSSVAWSLLALAYQYVFLVVHLQADLEGVFAHAQRDRVLAAQVLGQRAHGRPELGFRNGLVHQTHIGSAPSVERLAGHRVVERIARAQRLADVLGHHPAREVFEVDFGEAERRFFRRDRDVARADDRERTAEAPTVNGGDRRRVEQPQDLIAPFVGDGANALALELAVSFREVVEVFLDLDRRRSSRRHR